MKDNSIKNGLFPLGNDVFLHFFQTQAGDEVRLSFSKDQERNSWSLLGIGPQLLEFFYMNRPEACLRSLKMLLEEHPEIWDVLLASREKLDQKTEE